MPFISSKQKSDRCGKMVVKFSLPCETEYFHSFLDESESTHNTKTPRKIVTDFRKTVNDSLNAPLNSE